MVDLKVVYKGKVPLFSWCGPLASTLGTVDVQIHRAQHTPLQVTGLKSSTRRETCVGCSCAVQMGWILAKLSLATLYFDSCYAMLWCHIPSLYPSVALLYNYTHLFCRVLTY